MSRVNLLWFLNESCCVQGVGFVHGASLFLMVSVKKKNKANVYFWLRIVYFLRYSSFIFSHCRKAFSPGIRTGFARKDKYEKISVFVDLFYWYE